MCDRYEKHMADLKDSQNAASRHKQMRKLVCQLHPLSVAPGVISQPDKHKHKK
jgi:hypothetical protein